MVLEEYMIKNILANIVKRSCIKSQILDKTSWYSVMQAKVDPSQICINLFFFSPAGKNCVEKVMCSL